MASTIRNLGGKQALNITTAEGSMDSKFIRYEKFGERI